MSRSNHFGFSNNQVDAQKAALHEEKVWQQLNNFEASMRGLGQRFGSWASDHFFFEMELRIDKGLQLHLQGEAFGAKLGGGFENNTEPLVQLNLGFDERFYWKAYAFDNMSYGYGGVNDPIRNGWSATLFAGATQSFDSRRGILKYGELRSENINVVAFNISKTYGVGGKVIEQQQFSE